MSPLCFLYMCFLCGPCAADRVLAGNTLLTFLPTDTHQDLYNIMALMWQRSPKARPLMSEVHSRLQDLELVLMQEVCVLGVGERVRVCARVPVVGCR